MKDYNKSDVSFLKEMIVHHKAALKMASSVYSKGENKEVRKLAFNILETQSKEIKIMEQWLKDHGYEVDSEKMDLHK